MTEGFTASILQSLTRIAYGQDQTTIATDIASAFLRDLYVVGPSVILLIVFHLRVAITAVLFAKSLLAVATFCIRTALRALLFGLCVVALFLSCLCGTVAHFCSTLFRRCRSVFSHRGLSVVSHTSFGSHPVEPVASFSTAPSGSSPPLPHSSSSCSSSDKTSAEKSATAAATKQSFSAAPQHLPQSSHTTAPCTTNTTTSFFSSSHRRLCSLFSSSAGSSSTTDSFVLTPAEIAQIQVPSYFTERSKNSRSDNQQWGFSRLRIIYESSPVSPSIGEFKSSKSAFSAASSSSSTSSCWAPLLGPSGESVSCKFAAWFFGPPSASVSIIDYYFDTTVSELCFLIDVQIPNAFRWSPTDKSESKHSSQNTDPASNVTKQSKSETCATGRASSALLNNAFSQRVVAVASKAARLRASIYEVSSKLAAVVSTLSSAFIHNHIFSFEKHLKKHGHHGVSAVQVLRLRFGLESARRRKVHESNTGRFIDGLPSTVIRSRHLLHDALCFAIEHNFSRLVVQPIAWLYRRVFPPKKDALNSEPRLTLAQRAPSKGAGVLIADPDSDRHTSPIEQSKKKRVGSCQNPSCRNYDGSSSSTIPQDAKSTKTSSTRSVMGGICSLCDDKDNAGGGRDQRGQPNGTDTLPPATINGVILKHAGPTISYDTATDLGQESWLLQQSDGTRIFYNDNSDRMLTAVVEVTPESKVQIYFNGRKPPPSTSLAPNADGAPSSTQTPTNYGATGGGATPMSAQAGGAAAKPKVDMTGVEVASEIVKSKAAKKSANVVSVVDADTEGSCAFEVKLAPGQTAAMIRFVAGRLSVRYRTTRITAENNIAISAPPTPSNAGGRVSPSRNGSHNTIGGGGADAEGASAGGMPLHPDLQTDAARVVSILLELLKRQENSEAVVVRKLTEDIRAMEAAIDEKRRKLNPFASPDSTSTSACGTPVASITTSRQQTPTAVSPTARGGQRNGGGVTGTGGGVSGGGCAIPTPTGRSPTRSPARSPRQRSAASKSAGVGATSSGGLPAIPLSETMLGPDDDEDDDDEGAPPPDWSGPTCPNLGRSTMTPAQAATLPPKAKAEDAGRPKTSKGTAAATKTKAKVTATVITKGKPQQGTAPERLGGFAVLYKYFEALATLSTLNSASSSSSAKTAATLDSMVEDSSAFETSSFASMAATSQDIVVAALAQDAIDLLLALDCARRSARFVDVAFPPIHSSFGDNVDGSEALVWRRMAEFSGAGATPSHAMDDDDDDEDDDGIDDGRGDKFRQEARHPSSMPSSVRTSRQTSQQTSKQTSRAVTPTATPTNAHAPAAEYSFTSGGGSSTTAPPKIVTAGAKGKSTPTTSPKPKPVGGGGGAPGPSLFLTPSARSVRQGGLKDCYLCASMASVAGENSGAAIRKLFPFASVGDDESKKTAKKKDGGDDDSSPKDAAATAAFLNDIPLETKQLLVLALTNDAESARLLRFSPTDGLYDTSNKAHMHSQVNGLLSKHLSKLPSIGCVLVRVCYFGVWRTIVLDDFLPAIGARPAFAHSDLVNGKQELWPALLEKAYAKAYGNHASVSVDDGIAAFNASTSNTSSNSGARSMAKKAPTSRKACIESLTMLTSQLRSGPQIGSNPKLLATASDALASWSVLSFNGGTHHHSSSLQSSTAKTPTVKMAPTTTANVDLAVSLMRSTYGRIQAGDPVQALASLTGDPTYRLDSQWDATRIALEKIEKQTFFSFGRKKDKDDSALDPKTQMATTFEELRRWKERGFMIAFATPEGAEGSMQGHVFSCHAVLERTTMTSTYRVLYLRNPWGHDDNWDGATSMPWGPPPAPPASAQTSAAAGGGDRDKKKDKKKVKCDMTVVTAVKKACDETAKKLRHCGFWITFEDAVRRFDYASMCTYRPGWNEVRLHPWVSSSSIHIKPAPESPGAIGSQKSNQGQTSTAQTPTSASVPQTPVSGASTPTAAQIPTSAKTPMASFLAAAQKDRDRPAPTDVCYEVQVPFSLLLSSTDSARYCDSASLPQTSSTSGSGSGPGKSGSGKASTPFDPHADTAMKSAGTTLLDQLLGTTPVPPTPTSSSAKKKGSTTNGTAASVRALSDSEKFFRFLCSMVSSHVVELDKERAAAAGLDTPTASKNPKGQGQQSSKDGKDKHSSVASKDTSETLFTTFHCGGGAKRQKEVAVILDNESRIGVDLIVTLYQQSLRNNGCDSAMSSVYCVLPAALFSHLSSGSTDVEFVSEFAQMSPKNVAAMRRLQQQEMGSSSPGAVTPTATTPTSSSTRGAAGRHVDPAARLEDVSMMPPSMLCSPVPPHVVTYLSSVSPVASGKILGALRSMKTKESGLAFRIAGSAEGTESGTGGLTAEHSKASRVSVRAELSANAIAKSSTVAQALKMFLVKHSAQQSQARGRGMENNGSSGGFDQSRVRSISPSSRTPTFGSPPLAMPQLDGASPPRSPANSSRAGRGGFDSSPATTPLRSLTHLSFLIIPSRVVPQTNSGSGDRDQERPFSFSTAFRSPLPLQCGADIQIDDNRPGAAFLASSLSSSPMAAKAAGTKPPAAGGGGLPAPTGNTCMTASPANGVHDSPGQQSNPPKPNTGGSVKGTAGAVPEEEAVVIRVRHLPRDHELFEGGAAKARAFVDFGDLREVAV